MIRRVECFEYDINTMHFDWSSVYMLEVKPRKNPPWSEKI